MSVYITLERLSESAPGRVFVEISNIHIQEISEGFLSSLGATFLTRLYQIFAASPHAELIAALAGDRIIGFICVATNTSEVYKFFIRTAGISAAVRLLPKLVSPARLFRVLETLLYPSKGRSADLPKAEILNFCVTREMQGKGVGKKLFDAAMTCLKSRGVESIRIVTGEHQRSAQHFYDKIGARRVGDLEVHRGSTSILYVYEIS